MRVPHLKLFNFALCLGMYLCMSVTQATILNDEKSLKWVSKRDLTSSQFSSDFNKYKNQGLMMIDVDGYSVSGGLRYSMIWRENTDRRRWAEHRNLSSSQYYQKWVYYRDRGYRPLDTAAYRHNGTTYFAGIWVENKERIAWSSHRNLTSSAYGELFTQKRAQGYRLVDMEAYQTDNGLRYSAIWYENKDNIAWLQLRDMTRTRYQEEVNKRSSQGYTLVDYETYKNGRNRRYAAIWERKPGYASQVRTNRTKLQFANLWREYRDKGYRLVDFERIGNQYGGVWIENSSRYRYANKNQLDNVVENYLDANNLPGISVAIIENGNTIYRRGFGFADVGKGKVAHSETVYNAASVSKVIGGTLAAKLEATQQLENGQNIAFDMTDSAANYITNLPSQHTQTVEELFAHLGCVAHYTTTPSISNQTKHYNNATDALESLWDTGLVTVRANGANGCNIGTTSSYSTPAFTFVAAAMEQATNRTITQLLNSELFPPNGLGMRVQFASSNLPDNYERAVPYTNANIKTSYSNNSWKVLGGGIETSAYQLARFGWKVLDGQIVDAGTRDNRLWSAVAPSGTGIAWGLGWNDGRRVAQHSGSWTGARSYLRVYRDDGLVIAIMSNRSNHTVDDVGGLANDLADVVL